MHKDKRLLKEAMGVDLLVWIVGYKLSQIYNIPWIEFSRDYVALKLLRSVKTQSSGEVSYTFTVVLIYSQF